MKPAVVLMAYGSPERLEDVPAYYADIRGGQPIAPELLESQGYTKTVDWWTLGVLLYEMMTGLPPFYDENVNTMYQRILSDPLQFPADISPEAKSVMTGLLQRDPARRLGANGGEEIKRHPFFAKYVDWNL